MKYSIYIFCLLAAFSCTSCAAQYKKIETCSVQTLALIDENISHLSPKDIDRFTALLSANCKNNVEFMEFFNELLFKITEKYPTVILKQLSTLDKIELNLILEQYSNSLLDFNFKEIMKALNSVKGYDKLKSDVVTSIKKNTE